MKIVHIKSENKNFPEDQYAPMPGPWRAVFNITKHQSQLSNHKVLLYLLSSFHPLRSPARVTGWPAEVWRGSSPDLISKLLQIKPDLVHIHQASISYLPALIASKLNAIKTVVTTQSLFSREANLTRVPPFSKLSERVLINGCDRITCVGSQMLNWLTQDYNVSLQKITVVPNGVDQTLFNVQPSHTLLLGRFPKRNTEQRIKLLFAGGTWKFKGLPTLLAALPQLHTNMWELAIAGPDGDEQELVANQIKAFTDHIVVLGNLTTDELLAAYKIADIVVQPSRQETFGMVPLEAMAVGTPVIVSDQVGMKDAITDGHNGFIFKYDDSQQLANILNYVISLSQLERQVIGARAQEAARNYTWDIITKKYLAVYEQTLKN